MKQPDKFQEAAKRAMEWLSGHKRNSRLAVAAVVIAVVLVGIGMLVSNARGEKAGALVYDVLRAAGGEISSVPLPGVTGPFFATDADRQAAVVAAADRVLAPYASTAAGRLALLMKGDAQLRLGKNEDAIASYEKYLSVSASEEPLRFGALEGIALAKEAGGKLDDAAAAWDRASRGSAAFSDHADLERARVLAAAGKTDDAKKLLDGFEKRHTGSPFASEAADRLARLGGK